MFACAGMAGDSGLCSIETVGLSKPLPPLQRLRPFGLVLFNSLPKSSRTQNEKQVVGM